MKADRASRPLEWSHPPYATKASVGQTSNLVLVLLTTPFPPIARNIVRGHYGKAFIGHEIAPRCRVVALANLRFVRMVGRYGDLSGHYEARPVNR